MSNPVASWDRGGVSPHSESILLLFPRATSSSGRHTGGRGNGRQFCLYSQVETLTRSSIR